MNPEVISSVRLFCDNYSELKKPLYWKTSSLYTKLCALSYTLEGTRASSDNLLEAIDYIKRNSSWFSYMRSSRFFAAGVLTASGKRIEPMYDLLENCYKALKTAGFSASNYLTIAAYALFATTPPSLYTQKADRAKVIFERMKMDHPFLTSYDDYASAVIMASSDRSSEELAIELEAVYRSLKTAGLHTGNGLQFLAQLLIFDTSSPDEKAARCLQIAEKLKDNKFKVSSMYYGTIGFLALAGDRWEAAVDDAIEAAILMKELKCWSISEKEFHMMIAASLVIRTTMVNIQPSDSTMLKVGIGTTIQAIIAAQAAACAGVAAAGAAAASSGGS